jgi:His-Xaa-Ser system protein HxsD
MENRSAKLEFNFDPAIHSLTAIKKAAHRFSAAYEVEISSAPSGDVRVVLTPRVAGSAATRLLQSFENEVLDQDLRELVSEETRSIRDLIFAQAFSELSLTDTAGENADYHGDPLDVLGATPKKGTNL